MPDFMAKFSFETKLDQIEVSQVNTAPEFQQPGFYMKQHDMFKTFGMYICIYKSG